MPDAKPLPIEAGLLERFLGAEQGVQWKPIEPATRADAARKRRTVPAARARTNATSRLAHYNDETARVEQRSAGAEEVLTVTSGPVGALVLIGECARRGLPTSLEPRNAGVLPGFPDGAIEARWDGRARPVRLGVPFADVVQLARYALP
jgi:hypothetical protein